VKLVECVNKVAQLYRRFLAAEPKGPNGAANELPRLVDASGALAGERRDFVQANSALDVMRQLEELGSPIGAFIREECKVGPDYSVKTTRLFQAWTGWCGRVGREHPGSAQTFGRDLRAALPGLKTIRAREGDGSLHYYQGLHLK
jgi:putative DNA primase/helicase